ncbi:carboxymuconolactone decarboxylase family protein [Nitrosomonas aestuarii]|uniref:carboxymuconolactone decarboxylase family protein n=1 Tax=Nitrosomonas aestuarii TaxID=52441 RepID=UPI000D2F7C10|nr:carboxymuconolactone decarboxylase family protein [Nitrosomonas aestuarii]MCP5244236.1 carboxymuconolactone decarboxylase family protein [Burkholderiales bacterium]MCW5597628.1 carboxymuconolactone decarboxylase family protein [Nitrosomonas sp.]PTN10762.1 putative peroxidase-related enzyme [Nitrosomonas aestuarii]
MARIEINSNFENGSKEILDRVMELRGQVPNIFKTAAHSPAALGFLLDGYTALGRSKISAQIKEKIALRVASLNDCDYCASAHAAMGRRLKFDENQIHDSLKGIAVDPKTKAALTLSEQIIEKQGKLSDDELANARDAGFSDAEILEVLAVTCINIFTNYFNHIAGTDLDYPFVSASGK